MVLVVLELTGDDAVGDKDEGVGDEHEGMGDEGEGVGSVVVTVSAAV